MHGGGKGKLTLLRKKKMAAHTASRETGND